MTSNQPHSETDLTGFDALWQIGYEETVDFIRDKNSKLVNKDKQEISLLEKEIEEKNFDLQKLEWQLNEREKELKLLYDELHRTIELNKKLNQQLDDYEELCKKQQSMLQIVGSDKLEEPVLPNFN